MRLPISFARALCAAAITALAVILPLKPAHAAEYSDLWVTAGEDAWGVNFVQWGNVIFATFYIYGADNKPIWYTAVMNWNGSSKYAGTLFTYQGTYFAAPWKPGDIVEQVAGTATFQPSTSNNYQGSLVYTVNGASAVTTVTKAIQRLVDAAPIPLDGKYYGGQSGEYRSCSDSGQNKTYFDHYTLQVTQSAANSVSLSFDYTSGLKCTLAGTLAQNGLLFGIATATYKCSDNLDTSATITDLKKTAQGIEGQFSAPSVGGNCREEARFSASRN
jgi:hypothetical protein